MSLTIVEYKGQQYTVEVDDLKAKAKSLCLKTTYERGGVECEVKPQVLVKRMGSRWPGTTERFLKSQEKGRGEAPAPAPAPVPEIDVDAEVEKADAGPAPKVEVKGEGIADALADTINSALAGFKPGLDEARVLELIKSNQEVIETERVIIVRDGQPKVELPKDQILHSCMEELIDNIQCRHHSMLVGPTGTGKTHIARQVAGILGMDYSHISCSEGLSEAKVEGWLVPGEGGKFVYLPAPFVERFSKGGIFLFDEFDAADPNLCTFVNAALANGHMSVPHRLEGSEIVRHPDFVCIVACNTFGTGSDMVYVGRNQLDAATLDRFMADRIWVDYDPNVEKALVPNRHLREWGHKVRRAITKHKLRRWISMRFLMKLSEKAAFKPEKYDTEKYWVEKLTMGWKEDEKAKLGLAAEAA